MTPLRLTYGTRELYALHLSATAGASRGHAVLMCNPFGQESLRSHRLYRVLGARLADAGFDVMRFDYHGTGDAGGDDAEFDLDGAVRDTRHAAHVLLQRSGARRVSLLGLRLGANIAQLASMDAALVVENLVLLEPLPDGDAYLRALTEANARGFEEGFGRRWAWDGRARVFNLGGREDDILGFALGVQCRAQIRDGLARTRLDPGRCARALVLAANPADYAQWGAGQDEAGREVTVLAAESGVDWATNSALNSAIVPRHWVERVLDVLTREVVDA